MYQYICNHRLGVYFRNMRLRGFNLHIYIHMIYGWNQQRWYYPKKKHFQPYLRIKSASGINITTYIFIN
ncbi:hypothetical protein RE92_25135 (plasmid) [Paenibacillus polymyxa]|nr:hypothetical protein RE92_25135 [Paenibacillus polymyxa]